MEYKRKRLIRAALQKAEAKRKQTVRQAESAADTEQQTPEEYAQTVVSEKTAQAAENLQSKALDTGRISYRQFRLLQEKHQRIPTTHAAQPPETENTPLGQSADKRETFKRQRFRQKALDKREIKTPDSYRDKMQALKRQHLTRETVRRHLQKQAGGTVLGSSVRLPDTVPVFSGGIRQAALGRIRTVLQAAWLRLKAVLARTIRRAAGSLLALLGAGGVVLLLAMVIGAAAAVIGSPMGILFADESGDPNSIRIVEIVAQTNADFGAAINDIVAAHPECSETTMEYDYEDGHTWASYWPEVLAVFAVQNNLNNDGDVVVIDESKKRLIQDTFWAMHEISAEVEEVTTTPEPTEDEPDPEPVTGYILHITVSSKSVDALADLYRFLRKTSGTFCTSCFPRKCVPACLPCAVGLLLRTVNCAGRCRGTPIYPATSGKWTPSAMPGTAARIFPRRRVRLSSPPTAVRYWSVAGTTATAIRCCWTTARACPRGTPI